jgi:hypothetical protein
MSVNEPEDNETPADEIPIQSETLEQDNAQEAEVRPTNSVDNPATEDVDPHKITE